MHNYQFAVTYKDRKHIATHGHKNTIIIIIVIYTNLKNKTHSILWTEKQIMFPVLLHIAIHLSTILGCSYAYYNVTHQLFDFCSLVTSHHPQGLKYPIYALLHSVTETSHKKY